jgi:MSHA biogenesis protein MshP
MTIRPFIDITPHASDTDRFNGHRNTGFALISAIFLMVVLAGLGVAMLTFTNTQQASSGYDVLGARAYQAARTGIEWGLYQRLNPQVSAPGVSPSYCQGSAANVTNTLTLPAGTTLSSFTVTISCVAVTSSNTPIPITVRTIQAIACNQPSSGVCPNPSPAADYAQRSVQVSIQENF